MQEDVLKYGGAEGHNETACIEREFIRFRLQCQLGKEEEAAEEGKGPGEGEADRGSEMVRWRIIGKQKEKWNGRKRTIFMHVTLRTDD